MVRMASIPPVMLHELDPLYAESEDRYVVSVIVTYADCAVSSPEEAVARALDFLRDDAADDTQWSVFDRHTQCLHRIPQGDAEAFSRWPSSHAPGRRAAVRASQRGSPVSPDTPPEGR